MAPPTEPLNLDVEAISGICGSISIACWVVVFSPQILENFRRGNADGLSLQFIIVWLVGDVFNILGAVMQGVLPTMVRICPRCLFRCAHTSNPYSSFSFQSLANTGSASMQTILAIYYTIADIVLLLQCFYYRGFTWKDEVVRPAPKPRSKRVQPNERTTLLDRPVLRERRGSNWSHLSPAVPLLDEPPATPPPPPTTAQTLFWNTTAILMVCAAGVLGWFLSRCYGPSEGGKHEKDGELTFDRLGQIFGWLCAVLYLGSRLPQLLLNYRRKSTEGVSMLFFLFACLGNMTYVMSIFAYDPHCENHVCAPGRSYGRYILVNLSWLAGSMGTLLLDMGIFVQYFLYKKDDEDEDEDENEENVENGDEYEEEENDTGSIEHHRWDQRPLLARGDSHYG
ncbi:PQ-loop-domain-containing protein [Sodiomyces alkalinus F11]|uniref:PQ-loop-domain-containing protein n=1 Tax=Sodiomyces alkalinus (strain CBS 110278 / VKM F-3762 / F11) TaxID=1314773 RepID=A0A3N2PMU8_SODAK|nr:PQ-loop-domain-containing protein [Sodiomyces alkalinus F11]ROT35848.1 PQ-loop-domain-containing protein [Sodiomyces alkalinus F11]